MYHLLFFPRAPPESEKSPQIRIQLNLQACSSFASITTIQTADIGMPDIGNDFVILPVSYSSTL